MIRTDDEDRDWGALAQAMCERHYGAGADGIILALPSNKGDVRMRLFNADGSEAEVSGNGVRCLVKYAVERGLSRSQETVTIEAASGLLGAEAQLNGSAVKGVRLSMGMPHFAPEEIPVAAEVEAPVLDLPLQVDGQQIRVSCLSMGNPHAVYFFTQPLERYPLEQIGPKVERHPLFPQRINFAVARILNRDRIDLRVWERGCGETLACGSGSCATMVAARLHHLVDDKVEITQQGGTLTVEWDGKGDVYLTGPAEFVYEGDWPD